MLAGLIAFLRDSGDRAQATAFAEKLAALAPWDPGVQALLKALRGESAP